MAEYRRYPYILEDLPISIMVIEGDRQSVALQIKSSQRIECRVPRHFGRERLDAYFAQSQVIEWLCETYARIQEFDQSILSPNSKTPPYTKEQIEEMAQRACSIIPSRVAHYAKCMGVSYGKITIRNQKTRWGSCSSKGNLNFNCVLVDMPIAILDCVVVHELCHRKHMNHSKEFYAMARESYPDFDQCSQWLKENGSLYMKRLHPV